jgi:hypothetical protein
MVTLLLIAISFALLLSTWWLYKRGIIVRTAVLLWILLVPYEIWYRANCPGECNIRADLVFLLAVLLVVTLAAIVWLVQKALTKRKASRAASQN